MSTTQGYCVPLDVEVEQENFTINGLAVGLAFFFGFIAGVIVLLICAKLCLKDFAKKKRQDAEQTMMQEQGLSPHQKHEIDYLQSRPSTAASIRARKRVQSAKKKKSGENEPLVPITPVTLMEEQITGIDGEDGKSRGLIDALVQPTVTAMEVEMVEQDLEAVNALERELKEESIMTMIQLMRTLLGQQMNKGKFSQDQYKDIMKDAQENVRDMVKQIQSEKDVDKEEIRRKYAKDPKKMQEELDKLHGKYMGKMNSVIGEEREKMHKVLQHKTDLSDEEIEALLAMYGKQMAHLEHKLGVERARQAASLEERLARRKQLAEQQQFETKMKSEAVHHHRDTNNKMTQHLVEKGNLSEKDRDLLLKEYDHDVNRLLMQKQLEYDKQKLSLADKLKKHRDEKMRKLQEKQEKEQDQFLKTSEKISGPDVVEAYHNLLQNQRQQREDLSDELDNIESEEIKRILKEEEQDQAEILDKVEEKFNQGLKAKGITSAELDRLLGIHQQEMQQFQHTKINERKKMKIKLEEKLAKRRKEVEEEQAMSLAEVQKVQEQQDMTINKMLASQVELTNEAREKILKEHEQNMTSINNQLQMSKLRQRKAMEARLAAKKAKVEQLREKEEELKRNRKHLKEKEKEKLQAQLEKQILDEEVKLEQERKHALNELRKSIAEETELALSEQEKQLSILIGRLQVGQARRQAIIAKQDKTIKNLEEKMAKKVEGAVDKSSNQQVDYLLKEHYRQVSDLNTQIQDVKERQEQKIRDKIEAKKLMKEREVEEKLESEAQEEWHKQKNRGALISTSILSQVMLENRHKAEMQRLENDMHVEMQKQREKLNDELELELQQELADRKKSFLAQIAAISNMSKADVNEIVDNVVEATGGSEREAKQLRKEFNQDVQKAKSQLGVTGDEYSSKRGSARKTRGNINNGYTDDNHQNFLRPKSGARSKKHTTITEYHSEEDEDF